jgi:hypothetical protein
MSDLLMRRSAIIGGVDSCYRYELRRIWDDALPLLVVCMLNPSTADAEPRCCSSRRAAASA